MCLPFQTFLTFSTFELPPLPLVKYFGFPRQNHPEKAPEVSTGGTEEEVWVLFDLIITWAGVTGKAEWYRSIHTAPTGLCSIPGEEQRRIKRAGKEDLQLQHTIGASIDNPLPGKDE